MSQAVTEEAWTAAIPVTLKLSLSEVTAVEGSPAPLHVLLPRLSYLPSLLSQALNHFRHVLPPEVKESVNTPWFETDGLPLRWHYPAGVLYDILFRGKPSAEWSVTIHFRDYPKDTLLAWDGSQPLLSAFLNSLKEAAVICSGQAAAILQMSQQAQHDLWQSVETPNLTAYQRVANSLNLTPRSKGDKLPNIPLRLYLQSSSSDYMSSYEGVDYTSRPVPAVNSHGVSPTLGETLQHLMPHAFRLETESSSEDVAETSSSAQTVEADSQIPSAKVEVDSGKQSRLLQQFSSKHSVLVAGIQPPLQTPLAWLYNTLHSPDMFLYVIVIAT